MDRNINSLQEWLNKTVDMIIKRKRSQMVGEISDKWDIPTFKKIKVKKETKEYLDLTQRFEAAVNDVLAGEEEELVATNYELDFETLRDEVCRFKNSGAETYEYNGTGRIFSFKEELQLLKILAAIPRADMSQCICQTCSLKRLPYMAYRMAKEKNKIYPREWDLKQQAGKGWLIKFEIEYDYEILNSFPAVCKLTPNNSSEINKEDKRQKEEI
ncbi:PREDICTED: uncharacterized protein LOC105146602 [Acromyrmex echinatior]|uniref:uncharacterized protein LOC105146602 n=1 Tax=Acromyrmex echinatior TaxID=103372 RepID=UPI000580C93C|nr:PREDICTED: uncharacterized protein LOC105146602 [Acromyrmex echinatior]XP_011055274.1 PREDICTED: uncharacterized protein LOC105146602 [Acromyrmex echinatior]XP_011055275.1 PREDICTED: uncharacterized protein LOC105146602 [Acromyrmex echinatior]